LDNTGTEYQDPIRFTTPALQKFTPQLIGWRVFRLQIIFIRYKNGLGYYSAGVEDVNSKGVGLAPEYEKSTSQWMKFRCYKNRNKKSRFFD
jgi:hypothetical protein